MTDAANKAEAHEFILKLSDPDGPADKGNVLP